MIILPVSTPAVAVDQSNVNQSQLNQSQSLQDSRKATDTVQLPTEARRMASAESTYVAVAQAIVNKPPETQESSASANGVSLATEVKDAPAPRHIAADNEVAEKVADNEIAEQQRPTNAVSGKNETTKIDVVA